MLPAWSTLAEDVDYPSVENGNTPFWKITKAIFVLNHVHTVQSAGLKKKTKQKPSMMSSPLFFFLNQQSGRPAAGRSFHVSNGSAFQFLRKWIAGADRLLGGLSKLSGSPIYSWLCGSSDMHTHGGFYRDRGGHVVTDVGGLEFIHFQPVKRLNSTFIGATWVSGTAATQTYHTHHILWHFPLKKLI